MNKSVSKVRTHVKKNKNAYVVGSVCLVVGAAAATAVFLRFSSGVTAVQKITQIGLRNENTSVLIQLAELSTPSKPVWEPATKQYFNSIGDAARKTGFSASRISQNANGLIDNIKGRVFEFVDLGTDVA